MTFVKYPLYCDESIYIYFYNNKNIFIYHVQSKEDQIILFNDFNSEFDIVFPLDTLIHLNLTKTLLKNQMFAESDTRRFLTLKNNISKNKKSEDKAQIIENNMIFVSEKKNFIRNIQTESLYKFSEYLYLFTKNNCSNIKNAEYNLYDIDGSVFEFITSYLGNMVIDMKSLLEIINNFDLLSIVLLN